MTKTLSLEALIKRAEKDTIVSADTAQYYSLTVMSLVTKWVGFHTQENINYLKAKKNFSKKYLEKWYHYTRDVDLLLEPKSKELQIHLDADDNLIELQGILVTSKTKMEFIEKTILTLRSASYHIGNFVKLKIYSEE